MSAPAKKAALHSMIAIAIFWLARFVAGANKQGLEREGIGELLLADASSASPNYCETQASSVVLVELFSVRGTWVNTYTPSF